jgi:hypothetical protein
VSITIPTHTTVMHPSSTAIADASAGLLDRLDLTDAQWQTVRVSPRRTRAARRASSRVSRSPAGQTARAPPGAR